MDIFKARKILISDLKAAGFGEAVSKPIPNYKYKDGDFTIHNPGGYGSDNIIKFYFSGVWVRIGSLSQNAPFRITWGKKGTATLSPLRPDKLVEGETWVQLMPDGAEIIRRLEEGELIDANAQIKKHFILHKAKVFVDQIHGDDSNTGFNERDALQSLTQVYFNFGNVYDLEIIFCSSYSVEGEIIKRMITPEDVSFIDTVRLTAQAKNINLYHIEGSIWAKKVFLNINTILAPEGTSSKALFLGDYLTIEVGKDTIITGKENGSCLSGANNNIINVWPGENLQRMEGYFIYDKSKDKSRKYMKVV